MVMQDVNHQLFSDSVKNECLSVNPNATNQEIENLLNSFDLLDCIDRHPLTLSGWQRQRLAICQAIMAKKKFLIFDEPTSGLDFRHMWQVTERLKQLSQHGYILFVVTHDYEFLNRACNCYVRIEKINWLEKWKSSDFERSNLLSDLQQQQQPPHRSPDRCGGCCAYYVLYLHLIPELFKHQDFVPIIPIVAVA